MSRVWKTPVQIVDGVSLDISSDIVKVKWPKGELSFNLAPFVTVSVSDDNICNVVIEDESDKNQRAFWWLTRSVIFNMIDWVSKWYTKALEINWVGYKFELKWTSDLILSVWFSHKVEMKAPEWIELKVDEKKKNILYVSWIDKQLVWEFAAKIRSTKKPEPYKGKGIKYVSEQIKRKAWKAWSA